MIQEKIQHSLNHALALVTLIAKLAQDGDIIALSQMAAEKIKEVKEALG